MKDKKTPREAFENAVANILHRWDREDDYGVEHVVADIHAALASGQQASEPVGAGDGAPYIKITFPDLAQAHSAHAELLAATQPPTGEAAQGPKDHEIARAVNELRAIAIEFHATQQLRERIVGIVLPLVKRTPRKSCRACRGSGYTEESGNGEGGGGIAYFACEACNATPPAASGARDAVPATKLDVACWQCDNCGHIGINDCTSPDSACHACDWTGDHPQSEACPGCGGHNCLEDVCPKCGGPYKLLTETTIDAARASADEKGQSNG